MRKITLLTDINAIWIYNDRKIYIDLTNKFFEKHGIDLKLIEKVDNEVFPKLAKLGRNGKMSYLEVIEGYFKALGIRNYKKMAKNYIKFEVKNLKKYIKLCKSSKKTLSVLKKRGVRIIGITDSMYSIKEIKSILKILGIGKYFDKIYTSNSLKTEKPKAFEFFKNGKNMVFLGHEDDELIGAKKYGFLTIGLNNRNAKYFISSIRKLPTTIKKLMKE